MRCAVRAVLTAVVLSSALAVIPTAAAEPGPSPERPPAGSYDETRLLVAFSPGTPGEERRSAHAAQGAAYAVILVFSRVAHP